jgi:very-short-patch-repair endonuclease
MGFRVLRFWVTELDENVEGVITAVAEALEISTPRPPPISPRLGEDLTV